jgi:hypothetical protein
LLQNAPARFVLRRSLVDLVSAVEYATVIGPSVSRQAPGATLSSKGAEVIFDTRRFSELAKRTQLHQAIGETADATIDEAAALIEFFQSEVSEFVSALQPQRAPELAPDIRDVAAMLLRIGFVTHCMCNRPPMRPLAYSLDRRDVVRRWVQESILSHAYVERLDRVSHRGYLRRMFELAYLEIVEPFEKSVHADWWRRFRNKPRWRDQFAAGVVLGVILDHLVVEAQKEKSINETPADPPDDRRAGQALESTQPPNADANLGDVSADQVVPSGNSWARNVRIRCQSCGRDVIAQCGAPDSAIGPLEWTCLFCDAKQVNDFGAAVYWIKPPA